MSQYRISLSASQDLNQISEYFLTRNLTAGERFFAGASQLGNIALIPQPLLPNREKGCLPSEMHPFLQNLTRNANT